MTTQVNLLVLFNDWVYFKTQRDEVLTEMLKVRCLVLDHDFGGGIPLKILSSKFKDGIYYTFLDFEKNYQIKKFLELKNLKKEIDRDLEYRKALKVEEDQIIKLSNLFIESFLNPKYGDFWAVNQGSLTQDRYEYMEALNDQCEIIGQAHIAEFIKSMNYKDFLKTIYWKHVSRIIKKKADDKCQLCFSEENLNTHHRSYSRHGWELRDQEDLICICNSCHTNHHNK